MTGDVDTAEAHLNRCLKLNKGATEAVQLEFLLLRVQTGELDQVASTLIASVEKDHPEAALILETLARAYMHRLQYRPAHACLSRWIDLHPDAARAYQWRGWVFERLSQAKRAIDDYLKALELDPELFAVRLRLAEMYLEDSNPQEALPHLEWLSDRYPDSPYVLARLGQCRYLQGEGEEARRLLEAAVVKLPRDPGLLIYLAKQDIQDGRLTEAETRLRHVLKTDPADTEALYALGNVLQLQGRPKEASAVLAEWEKQDALVRRTNRLLKNEAETPTTTAEVPWEIGTLLLRMGKEGQGLYWLHQALERDPGHQKTHKALAEHYESTGDPDKAAAHRRQAR